MAQYYDIKSIILPHDEDELHIMCGTAEIEDGAVTDTKLAQSGGVLSSVSRLTSDIEDQMPFNSDMFVSFSNRFYDTQNGTSYDHGKYVATGKIACGSEQEIAFYNCPTVAKYVLFYGADDSYLGYTTPSSGRTDVTVTSLAGSESFVIEFGFGVNTDASTVDPIRIYVNPQATVDDRLWRIDNYLSDFFEVSEMALVFEAGSYNISNNAFLATGTHAIVSAEDAHVLIRAYAASVNLSTPAIVFFSGEPSASTFISSVGATQSWNVSVINDVDANIPDNCAYVCVQSLNVSNRSFGTVQMVESEHDRNMPRYTLANDLLTVSYPYGDETMTVTFGRRGPNALPDFRTIGTAARTLYNNTTDWHGPFVVGATSNADGDDPAQQTFTGGNHNYNNSGSTDYSATARNVSLDYYADGVALEDGASGSASSIRIEWSNRVQAYNTRKSDGSGREVLEERHVMTFDGLNWDSVVELQALEDVTMVKYYGYQCLVNPGWPTVCYVGGENRQRLGYASNPSSGNAKPNAMDCSSATDRLIMGVDRTLDLGTGNMYEGVDGMFVSGGKGYSWLIKDRAMATGDVYAARGWWQFTPMSF